MDGGLNYYSPFCLKIIVVLQKTTFKKINFITLFLYYRNSILLKYILKLICILETNSRVGMCKDYFNYTYSLSICMGVIIKGMEVVKYIV